MAKIKIPNQVIPDDARSEEGRKRELKAWKGAKNFVAMNAFMEKLENGTLKRDIEPTILEEFIPTEEVITSELDGYTKLLKSGIIEKATNAEKGPRLIKNKQK